MDPIDSNFMKKNKISLDIEYKLKNFLINLIFYFMVGQVNGNIQ